MLDKDLLEILVCPACRGNVREEENKVICVKCGRKYPIENGIPIMLVDEAEK